MGGIWGSREFFVDSLTEIAGYKAGVVLTPRELFALLKDEGDVGLILDPNGPGGGRLHSSDFTAAVVTLLHRLGNTPSPSSVPITIELYHKYRKTPLEPVYQGLMEAYLTFMKDALGVDQPTGMIDPTPLMFQMFEQFGDDGASMTMELLEGVNRDLHRSPWGSIRQVDWKDRVELTGLFQSAGLETQHGSFFDQRYIDYLSQNFEEIDRMHWRKFEGFTAEYFDREGFHVVLGPGGNDGGVDVRVYPRDATPERPPLILVQCKRQKAKIEKVLVKSVYADVVHEDADSGLIVTTSALAPGAEAVRTARNYPVEAADRTTLRTWIDKLRS